MGSIVLFFLLFPLRLIGYALQIVPTCHFDAAISLPLLPFYYLNASLIIIRRDGSVIILPLRGFIILFCEVGRFESKDTIAYFRLLVDQCV